ncbi:baseplate J/gp47 family protein [Parachitinimonas caeni]|uniref:Baseplate protein J-like domain-containing protein n=1 Tax=Parachitinimonas caeni TaxID=3031301 RepID=A0ABT7DZI5_9NEIS|nr:hypothetical protein [Parachitinimonas caeni]MDK2125456.1 hypothetical protein [Parachitinimonas caeni]
MRQFTDPSRSSPGSLQEQRGLPAQSASHFSVEERSASDWLALWQALAGRMHFFNQDNLPDGNWQALLPAPEHWPALQAWVSDGTPLPAALLAETANRPDLALLLAFLRLQRFPAQAFANLTEAHRQYYYQQVLGLTPRPGRPDESDLILTLNPDASPYTLPAGTRFSAGNDANGDELIYASVDALPLNHARVAKVLTVGQSHRDHHGRKLSRLIRTVVRDEKAEVDWHSVPVLGKEASEDEHDRVFLPGWQLQSPLLWLGGGERSISLILQGQDAKALRELLGGDSSKLATAFNHYWQASVSGQDGAFSLENAELDWSPGAAAAVETLTIRYKLSPLDPPVCGQPGSDPYLSFTLRSQPQTVTGLDSHQDGWVENYDAWQYLAFVETGDRALRLRVEVDGLMPAALRSDQGGLDTDTPFEPWDYQPRQGARLLFTHSEIAGKTLERLQLQVTWQDRPASLLGQKPEDYYGPYRSYLFPDTASQPGNGGGTPPGGPAPQPVPPPPWPVPRVRLRDARGASLPAVNEAGVLILNQDIDLLRFNLKAAANVFFPPKSKVPDLSGLQEASADVRDWPHWFALEWSGDSLGHSLFSEVQAKSQRNYTEQLIQWSKSGKPEDKPQLVVVNAPYTPRVSSLRIGYSASVEWHGHAAMQISQQHPLGPVPVSAPSAGRPARVLAELRTDSHLFIGLAEQPQPGLCALRFDISPLASPGGQDVATLRWRYFDGQRWLALAADRFNSTIGASLLNDGSNDLHNSGIVQLQLAEAPLGSDGLYWLGVSPDLDGGINPLMVPPQFAHLHGIDTQALRVRYAGSNEARLAEPLPAESISDLASPDAAIEKVRQPSPSQFGLPGEEAHRFACRAAERLRHKNRAVTPWDYERLLLADFPELALAKCLRVVDDGRIVPGRALLMVAPRPDTPGQLQPMPSRDLSRRITEALKQRMAPGIQLSISAPRYRQIRLILNLIFNPAYDVGRTVVEINKRLVALLSPWQKAQVIPSDCCYLSEVASFVAQQPEVTQVVAIRAESRVGTGPWEAGNDLWVRTESADEILVPAAEHVFAKLQSVDEPFDGIGWMTIERDFVVAVNGRKLLSEPGIGGQVLGWSLSIG